MNNKVLVFILFAIFSSLSACVEPMDIDLDNENQYRVVLDGVLSNEAPPYYFRLSKTATFTEPYNKGIQDAQLIITDAEGVKDTLRHVNYADATTKGYGEGDNDADSLKYVGYYKTTKIIGKEGCRYTISINYDGQYYEATETMPYATEIDSVWLVYKHLESKDETVLCPYINFENKTDEDNFYLFTFRKENPETMHSSTWRAWQVSVLEDTFLPEYVSDFNINDGESVRGYEEGFHFPFSESDTNIVRLNSITKECYDYYSDLIKQIRFDGGAFTPTPLTVRGNVSNGALGYFRVSSVSEAKVLYNKE